MKIKMFIITCIFNTTLLLGQASEFYINLESQHFLLIDSQGRKSGYNYTPKPYVYEIPYLSYGDDGIGDDDGDNSTYEPIWTMGFDITPFDSAFRESYTLLIQGTKLNRYKGLIYLRAYSRVLSLNISGVIDSLQSISYKLSFSSISGEYSSVSKLVNALSLSQSISSYLKMTSINNRGIANSLLQKIENAGKQKEKGQTKAAINLLQAFINEVKAQLGKAVAKDAAELLIADAEQLLKEWSGQ